MFGISTVELSTIGAFFLAIIAGVIFLIRALIRSITPGKNQAERLKELHKMKNEGLISEDEFTKKRNEILDSI